MSSQFFFILFDLSYLELNSAIISSKVTFTGKSLLLNLRFKGG